MRELYLLTSLNELNDAFIAEAAPKEKQHFRISHLATMAACLALVLVAVGLVRLVPLSNTSILLPTLSERSQGISVRYNANPKTAMTEGCLAWLSLEEIFAPETMIFRGTVRDIQNYDLSFNGDVVTRAIATVSVSEVLQGDVCVGAEIQILLPCPITGDIRISATEVTAQMRVDMEGIFMPKAYDADAYWEQNGAILYLQDLAPCGLWDGMRWVFLDTNRGLVFDKSVHEGAVNSESLDEIEDYIREQIK